jgi:hypothetical protein
VRLTVRSGLPARKDGVWLREALGESVLFDPSSERVHLVNHSALAIWNLCDGETTPEEMIDAIVHISDLPDEVVAEDVGRILREFDDAGLIVWREG